MIIRSRAPVRIDLAGGWTDVPPFADREGGAVVNVAINRYTYATLQPQSEGSIRIRSSDYNTFVEARTADELCYDGMLDLAKAAIKRLGIAGGVALTTRADTPPGSGLGSSGAMGVALVGVLNALQPNRLAPHAIADLANRLEVEELHIAGGKQDQLAAALGGINVLEFGDHPPVSSRLPISAGVVSELEKRLVLCYSGISRLSGNIIKRVQQAYINGEARTCSALRTMRDLAYQTQYALLRGTVDDLAPILRENWACQRALHPSVTHTDVDRLFQIAERHGALGGKACGAGGGGCLAFWCEADAEHAVREVLAEAGCRIIDFNIDRSGLQLWRIGENGQVM